MEHRSLGASGLKVSELVHGTWISRTEGDAEQCVRAALDCGVTTFDTADVYGGTLAEVVLGRVLSGVRRESVVVCSKVCAPVGPGPNDRGLSRKHVIESVHGSLRRLQTDYLDVYQAHRYDPRTPLEETLRAFDDLVRQGKVLYVGVSEWTAEQIDRAARTAREMGLDPIVSNQPQYSMLWRVVEQEVLPVCTRLGIGQLAWSPLAQGLLTGKYLPGLPPPQGSRAAGPASAVFALGALRPDVLERIQNLRPLAAEADLTLPQLALAWVLNRPGVSAAIVGASSPAQIKECAEASGVELDAELVARVDDVLGAVVERDPRKIPSQPRDLGRERPEQDDPGQARREAGG